MGISYDCNPKDVISFEQMKKNQEEQEHTFEENISANNIYEDLNSIYNDEMDMMRSAQLYYFKFYLPMILTKVDQASMFNSVENRSPFLSKKIINFSLNQDLNKLYKFFRKKYFIRKMYNNDIPKKILNRKKHGFAFPKEILLKDKNLVENLLNRDLLVNKSFFESKYN